MSLLLYVLNRDACGLFQTGDDVTFRRVSDLIEDLSKFPPDLFVAMMDQYSFCEGDPSPRLMWVVDHAGPLELVYEKPDNDPTTHQVVAL